MMVRTSEIARVRDREEGNTQPIGIPLWRKVSVPLSSFASASPPSASFIDTSVLEVALTWILHQRVLSTIRCHHSLDRQIVDFSRSVFDAIGSAGRHDIKSEHLWMIYFTGLLFAKTHPREAMVAAINTIRQQIAMEAVTTTEKVKIVEEASRPAKRYTVVDAADREVLNQIADALGDTSANRPRPS
jgi:hypothetical protein